VLLVEDHDAVLGMMRMTLEHKGLDEVNSNHTQQGGSLTLERM
jgi:hypothetical protein